jgi:hypothetical protein
MVNAPRRPSRAACLHQKQRHKENTAFSLCLGVFYLVFADEVGALQAQFSAFFKSPVPLYSAYCG